MQYEPKIQGKRIIKFCEFLSGWPLIICSLQTPPLFIANEAFRGSTKCRAVQSEGPTQYESVGCAD